MSQSPSSNPLAALDRDLRTALEDKNYTEALDIVEEIETKGGAKAFHLTAKAQCLLQLRRKQDAKVALLQAYEIDAGYHAASDLLDRNFPGWSLPKPKPRTSAMTLGGGSSPSFGSVGSAGGFGSASSPASSQSGSGFHAPPAPAPGGTQSPPVSQASISAAMGGMTQNVTSFKSDHQVNWQYVFNDLADLAKSGDLLGNSPVAGDDGMGSILNL
jgi:hypothetical protein